MPEWIYDPRLRGSGYRDAESGRILSLSQVRSMLDAHIDGAVDVGGTLADLVGDGMIRPEEWLEAMRQEIKDAYVAAYISGRGGRDMMGAEDWGSVGGSIADQYQFLDGFYDDILTQDLTPAQIAARASMYFNSAREAYERAMLRSAGEHGWTEHAWRLASAEHCDDCVVLAGEGFKPIDEPFIAPSSGQVAIPGSGDTICLTNCQCHQEFR